MSETLEEMVSRMCREDPVVNRMVHDVARGISEAERRYPCLDQTIEEVLKGAGIAGRTADELAEELQIHRAPAVIALGRLRVAGAILDSGERLSHRTKGKGIVWIASRFGSGRA